MQANRRFLRVMDIIASIILSGSNSRRAQSYFKLFYFSGHCDSGTYCLQSPQLDVLVNNGNGSPTMIEDK